LNQFRENLTLLPVLSQSGDFSWHQSLSDPVEEPNYRLRPLRSSTGFDFIQAVLKKT
jgi:hypothetical protein